MRCTVPNCHRRAMARQRHCHQHVKVSERTIRQLWAYLTAHQAERPTIKEAARALGHTVATICAARETLRERGILDYDARKARAWVLLELFCWVDLD